MQYLQHIDYGDQAAPLKVISLHGFPSIRSKQNRELAQGIADALKCRVRVVLYPGLSSPGIFSFKKTIIALIKEFPALITDRSRATTEKIDLLGHSFGGFCAILLAAKFPKLVKRVVLLSPLLRFNPSVTDVTGFFKGLLSVGIGDEVKTLAPEVLAEEFKDLSEDYSVKELIHELDPKLKLKFMQARIDNVTPTQMAEDFRQYFKCEFDYELVDQDHSFLIDRPGLSLKIADYLK